MTDKITTKEVYASLIELQTEVRLIGKNQGLSKKYFTRLVAIIIGAVFLDIVIHFILWSMK